MDHPRALRHPADREAVARDDRLLGTRVGRHDRLGRVGARRPSASAGDRRLERRAAACAAAAARRSRRSRGRAPPRRSSSSSRAASAAVASASSLPRSPVAAFATPELIDHRLRLGEREVLAVDLQARGLDVVAREHRPAGRVRHASGRPRGPCGRGGGCPRATPEATKPLAAVTLIPARSRSRRPAVSVEPEREVRVLHRLPGGALAEVVERADDDRDAGRAVGEDADLGRVGALDARDLRLDPSGSTRTTALPA